ncbi:MAG TPA: AMP-binding protein, partial [Streptosporangiaceae bacterium]|nr:AMP-binding protein [Streptosporangiaceae bacterium]
MSSSIMADRETIEARVGGRTLCDLLAATAAEYADLPAYSDREGDGAWQTVTWREHRDMALRLAAGLVSLGLEPGERVALMLPNRFEHVLADQAIVHAGGVPVTFYATLAADQIKYVAGDCDVKIAII